MARVALDAIATATELQVHDDDVGTKNVGGLHSFGRARCLADNDKVRLCPEHRPQSSPHDRVVVHQEEANR